MYLHNLKKCPMHFLPIAQCAMSVSRKIIGFKISSKIDASIVTQALENAYFSRKEPEGVMFHSDQGSQYTSKAFITQLFRYKIIQSNRDLVIAMIIHL